MNCMIAALGLITCIQAPVAEDVEIPASISEISPEEIQAGVDHLADDALYGRYWLSPFAHEAANWIRDRMQESGVAPGGEDGTWFQYTGTKDAAPNVIGLIKGTDPEAGVVIVGAHYDHLPPKRRGEDRIYNGADDNASGTVGMLAIARALVPLRDSLRSSVMFIAFTGEEAGLKGSKHFARKPTVPLERIRGLFNMDMISRGGENLIFIDGAAQSPDLIRALREANRSVGLELRVDTHPDWLSRSDQWPFLRRDVQAVLFSVEDHEDYHEVTDHADRIIPTLAAKVSRLVAIAVLDLAGEERVGSPTPEEPGSESDPKETPQ